MKSLRIAFILAISIVALKMCNNRDSFRFSGYSHYDILHQTLERIDEHIESQQDKYVKPESAVNSDIVLKSKSSNVSSQSISTPKHPNRFVLLDKKSLEAFFAKNKEVRPLEIYFTKDKNLIEAIVYRLNNIKEFDLISQATAFYACQKFYDHHTMTLYVKQTLDNRTMRYELNSSFCNSPSSSLSLLNRALDNSEFDIEILHKPPHYKRLQVTSVKKLYQEGIDSPDVVSWISKAVVNDRYFVFLDNDEQLQYYNRQTKELGQIPDLQRNHLPTAFALQGDMLYFVDKVLYAYNLKTHRYRSAIEPLGYADSVTIDGDMIYLLHEAYGHGWYLFAYNNRLTLQYAKYCNNDFVDVVLQGSTMIARDAKHWYRFDLHKGTLSATKNNTHLIIATSHRYTIDEDGTIYDENLTAVTSLHPHMHVSDAVFSKDFIFTHNQKKLAVYDTVMFHRKAAIANEDDYIIMILSKYALTLIDVSKPEIIVRRSKSNIIASLRD